jgi:hypothetical protein
LSNASQFNQNLYREGIIKSSESEEDISLHALGADERIKRQEMYQKMGQSEELYLKFLKYKKAKHQE